MNDGVEGPVQVVLRSLRHYITDGEWEDVKAGLPREFASVLP